MATVAKEIVDEIILGNGIYPGDMNNGLGPVVRIVRYRNYGGSESYGIVYRMEAEHGMLFRYEVPSEYIYDPEVIWRHHDWMVE